MTELLYQEDSYLKVFQATVTKVEGNLVYLNKTAFYPTSGGQPCDTGVLTTADGKTYELVGVRKTEHGIGHEVKELGLKEGDTVQGAINWERRYKLMRAHTAAHVLSATINKLTGALVTGKQLELDQNRVDFSLENFDRNQITQFTDDTNKTISAGAPVKWYTLPREEALKIPNIIRLATRMPPNLPELRIVEIEDVDIQACGGTHVKDIKEIGKIDVIKAENKGKTNRRVYFTLP